MLAAVVVLVEAGLVVRVHVPVVEEGVLAEADVDEGGLEVVFEVLDAALEDGADEALRVGVLDLEVLEVAVLQDGDAGFQGFGVDDDLALDGRLASDAEHALDGVFDGGDDGHGWVRGCVGGRWGARGGQRFARGRAWPSWKW